MKQIDKYIAPAIELIDSQLKDKGKVAKEYKGDISSFGTAILQSGLKAAVVLFSDGTSDAGKRRTKMVNILYELLHKEDEKAYKKYDKPTLDKYNGSHFLAHVLSDENPRTKQEAMNAAIAFKLALRTFSLTK